MTMAELQWRGGDPTALAWTCALAYLLAGGVCLWAARRHWPRRGRGSADAVLWLGLGSALAFLGVNKEADLQTIIVHTGRDAAHALGLYPYKYYIGGTFFLAVVLGGIVALWRGRQRLAEFGRAEPLATGGVTLIVIYTVIRFATIVHLGPRWFVGLEEVTLFVALEIVGSVLVALAALRAGRNLG